MQGLASGARTGAIAGGITLLLLAFAAPSFLDPLLPASLAILLLAGTLGAVIGSIAGLIARRTPVRAAGAAVGAAFGLTLGAAIVHWCSASAPVQVVLAAAVAGAAVLAYALAVFPGATRPRPALLAATVLSLAAVAAVGVARYTAGPPPGRFVVVGLDGGSWRVIDPLLAEGALPVTARIMREGATGVLWSMEPSSSSVLWTTIATGRRPEEHGVHDFYATQNAQLRATRFWEVASAAGERIGIFQWLVTWPPDPLPGFIVPGWLARDARTQPADLGFVKDLEIALQRRERPSVGSVLRIGADAVANGLTFGSVARIARDTLTASGLGEERAWYRAGKFAQLALHGDVFLERYRRDGPTVAAVVFYGSDALSHSYWKFHEPAAYPDVRPEDVRAYGDTIREYYRRFDAFLARLLDAVGPDTTVLVVSDHGFHAAQDHQLSVHTEPLLDLADAREAFTAHAINRQVYLTHRRAGTPEAAADVERVAATLRALHAGGTHLLDVKTTPGERVEIELREATGVSEDATITGGARPLDMGTLLARTTWSGSHENEGIILAVGPGIRRGWRGDGHVLDVAPTILAALGHPVADDMDGRVLTDLFVTPPAVTSVASHDRAMPQRVVAASHAAETDDDLDARLRALGYVR